MAKKKETNNEEKASGKGKGILIILLALVVLGAGAFGGFYFYLKSSSEKKVETTTYVITKETTINLSDSANSSKKSYLKTGVSLSYDKSNKKLGKEVESKKIQLQDATICYLKTKTAEDFENGNEVNVKKGLIEEINKILDNGKIIDVYYSTGEDSANFLVQS
ncbi:MAG: flagellar basal body-associated FliL family protein [Clostridiaceae bacterium]|nr:flagellar basal body-associated FliL family protein [Clostridiaceae bacterium]